MEIKSIFALRIQMNLCTEVLPCFRAEICRDGFPIEELFHFGIRKIMPTKASEDFVSEFFDAAENAPLVESRFFYEFKKFKRILKK